jgi:quercetin dioxygenase-like cupin family protein
MSRIIADVAGQARFSAEKMAKASLAEGEQLMLGLNCFEPGQEHASHAHGGSDKAYYVIAGRGTFTVGDETQQLEAGALVFAPAGVPHGVKNDGTDRLVVMVAIAPPIGRKG